MFGYVNIYKDELKVKDFNKFRSYYCGLCVALGKKYNQLVRLGLNYDLTFLSILYDSIYDTDSETKKSGCIKSVAKKNIIVNNKCIDYAADISVILVYYKLLDDIKDEKSIKALLAIIPYYFSVKKIKNNYFELISSIRANLKLLSDKEKSNCCVTDEVAHPFACIMSDIFNYANPSLKSLGYNIGRYVYFSDALDDMDKDLKTGNYNIYNNIFLYNGNPDDKLKQTIRDSLYLTLGSVASEYEKLPKFKNKELIDNIIYLGMRSKADMLLNSIGKIKERNSTND